MTNDELTRLEAMAAAASTGPWTHDLGEEPKYVWGEIEGANGGCVCVVMHHGNVNTVARLGEQFSHADARFIAASRETVPALIAEIRRLRAGRLTEDEVQALCHEQGEDCPRRFALGCLDYNRKLFGVKSRLELAPLRGKCGYRNHHETCDCNGEGGDR